MTLLEKYIAKVEEMKKNYNPIKSGADYYSAHEKILMYGAYTGAISDIQSLLPELIKEVQEEVEKMLIAELPKEDEQGREKIKDFLASLAEPNVEKVLKDWDKQADDLMNGREPDIK